MKKVYIVDEYISSQKNGIGRYINEVTAVLVDMLHIETTIIELNSPAKSFEISDNEKVKKIRIPQSSNFFSHDSFAVSCLVKLYVNDSENNIFLVNHSPCEGLINSLRSYFPLSRIVFAIHDLSWTGPLMGNSALFETIMKNRDTPEIKEKYEKVIEAIDGISKLLGLVDCTICLSRTTSRLVNEYYGIEKDKIYYTPNFLTDKKEDYSLRKKKNIKKRYNVLNDKIIISVGRTTKPKGSLALVKSFKAVLKTHPDARLVFIGPLVDSDKILAETKTISSRVTFTGLMPFSELLEWYQIADIGVISSYTEQCSYAGIEMLMSGLPIIASDGFGVNEMFVDNENSIVAKIEDYDDPAQYEQNLTDAMLRMLSTESLRDEFRIKARKAYEDKYSIKQAVSSLSELFR